MTIKLLDYIEKEAAKEGVSIEEWLLLKADEVTEGCGGRYEVQENALVELVYSTELDPAEVAMIRAAFVKVGCGKRIQDIGIGELIVAVQEQA